MESAATRKIYAVCCAEANKKSKMKKTNRSGASPGGFIALPELPENVPGEFSTPCGKGTGGQGIVRIEGKFGLTKVEFVRGGLYCGFSHLVGPPNLTHYHATLELQTSEELTTGSKNASPSTQLAAFYLYDLVVCEDILSNHH